MLSVELSDDLRSAPARRDSGMMDLGTLSGAVVTVAACGNTINNRGEVVGFSIDGTTGNSRAFYWRNGLIADLNTLVSNSPLYLLSSGSINEAGEITGQGCVMPACTVLHAYVAIPK